MVPCMVVSGMHELSLTITNVMPQPSSMSVARHRILRLSWQKEQSSNLAIGTKRKERCSPGHDIARKNEHSQMRTVFLRGLSC